MVDCDKEYKTDNKTETDRLSISPIDSLIEEALKLQEKKSEVKLANSTAWNFPYKDVQQSAPKQFDEESRAKEIPIMASCQSETLSQSEEDSCIIQRIRQIVGAVSYDTLIYLNDNLEKQDDSSSIDSIDSVYKSKDLIK